MNKFKLCIFLFTLGANLGPSFGDCPVEHSKLILIKGSDTDSASLKISKELFEKLKPRVLQLGYCLALNDWQELQGTGFLNSDKIIAIKYDRQLENETDSLFSYSYNLVAGVIEASRASKVKMEREGFRRPLAELELEASPAALNILAEKIAENLRDQYVCHLAIESEPAKVNFSLKNGYKGATPMELVIPLGEIHIKSDEKGYLPYEEKLNLMVPGYHKHIIKLKKKRFYHSKAMYPLAGFILAGLGSYYMQEYYYNQYSALNENDYTNRPEKFSELFHKAQFWERMWMSAAGLSLLTLGFSFSF